MRRTLLILTAFALVATGCSSGRSSRDPFAGGAGGGAADARLMVQVVNRNFNDATVWAVSGARRDRLGITPSNSNASYTVNWSGVRELRAEIDLVGGGRFTTPPITASSGDRVTLIIESRLTSSYLRR